MLDLRRVRTLREVAARGTIAAAADALHLTPSAASQQLSALEREVGRPLLDRTGRAITLTPAARVLLDRADAIFAELERLDADLHAEADGRAGTVRVGSFSSGLAALVAPAAAALRDTAIRLDVHDAEAPGALRALERRELDVVLTMESRHGPRHEDGRLTREPLLADRLDAALPQDHPDADRGEVDLAALAHDPFVMPLAASSCEDVIRAGCAHAGFTPHAAHRAGEWTATLALVGAGLGVALLPRLARLAPPPGVVLRPLAPPAPARHVIAVTRRGTEDHPAIRAVLRALHEAAQASLSSWAIMGAA